MAEEYYLGVRMEEPNFIKVNKETYDLMVGMPQVTGVWGDNTETWLTCNYPTIAKFIKDKEEYYIVEGKFEILKEEFDNLIKKNHKILLVTASCGNEKLYFDENENLFAVRKESAHISTREPEYNYYKVFSDKCKMKDYYGKEM